MKTKRILFGALLIGLASGFLAQDRAMSAPAPTLYGDGGVCDPWYPQNCLAPLGRVAVPGAQMGLAVASATAPTVPTGALAVLVLPVGTNNTSGQCLLWQDDGTAPTASVGNGLAAGQAMWYYIKASSTSSTINPNFKVIAASGASCTVNFSYYR